MDPDRLRRLLPFALFLSIFLIYAPGLNAPFVFDDFDNIVNNADIRSFKALARDALRSLEVPGSWEKVYWARPLTFASFAFSYLFSGLEPYGYRLFNVIAHACAAAVLFRVASALFAFIGETSPWAPFLCALLFAVHPVQTDAVTFISNRSDILAALFYLLAFGAFVRSLQEPGGGKSRALRVGALAAFIISFLFKEIAATLPAMLFLADALFISGGGRSAARRWRAHAPFWIVLAGFAALRPLYGGRLGYFYDWVHPWTNWSYFLTEIHVVARYAGMLLWPSGQSIDHWVEPIASAADPRVWGSLLGLIAGCAAFLAVLRGTAQFRLAVFAVCWFFIALAPTSSFLPINDAMVERRLYLPGLGWCLAFALLYRRIAGPRHRVFIALACAHAALLAGFTVRRNLRFNEPLSLWKETVEQYPRSFRAQFNYASALAEAGAEESEVRARYENSLRLRETHRPHVKLGALDAMRGDFAAAEAHFQQALRLEPNDAETHYNLGLLYFQTKDFAKSEAHYLKALELQPRQASAHFNLAALYYAQRRKADALAEMERAAQEAPESADIQRQLRWLRAELRK